jgi:uncharacterized protein
MQEKVTFTNSKGNKLVGILSNPKESTDVPIMIMAHGFSSNKEGHTRETLEQRYNEIGVATFRFDFFGHGESDGDFGDITVTEGMDDILEAITFIKSLGYKKIGLWGCSYGGITSILAAGHSKDLFILVLKCPVSDYMGKLLAESKEEQEEWKKKGWKPYTNSEGKTDKLKYTFFTDQNNENAYNVAKNINIPTLIVHGDADKVVPLEQSKKLASIIPRSKLIIVPGAGHRFLHMDHFHQSIDEFIKFVQSHL